MLKPCMSALLLCVFLFASVALQAQAAPSGACSNPADVKAMVNPVKPTAESLAQGKKYYGYDCSMCHGQSGNGKGDVDTGDKLPDFTNAAAIKEETDGELFFSRKDSKGHMPLKNVRVTPNELWNLVNYVRSLGK